MAACELGMYEPEAVDGVVNAPFWPGQTILLDESDSHVKVNSFFWGVDD